MTDHKVLAARAGEEHGREDAIFWLFAGYTDNDTVLVLDEKLKAGDPVVLAQMPNPHDSGRHYVPTDIWLGERIRQIDSPYSYYVELCEAYDDAYRQAVVDHVDRIAGAIREGAI